MTIYDVENALREIAARRDPQDVEVIVHGTLDAAKYAFANIAGGWDGALDNDNNCFTAVASAIINAYLSGYMDAVLKRR